MSNRIPYGRHSISNQDIEAVIDVLKSDWLTQGPKIEEFENSFADYVGSKYAIAVSNGTAALHLSTLVMGVQPGDKVITTPITFAASANSIRYCGGNVVFSDIDPSSYLLDLNKIRRLLEQAPRGTYKGIIPVDFAGRPVNLEDLRNLANEYNLWIIEDACHAPGGYFIDSSGKKQLCGNGVFADLTIFSFHPVKHIACGEGGMITTNDKDLYKSLIRLRSHGVTKELSQFHIPLYNKSATDKKTSYPEWYYEMQELGYNYRLTDFQAALGISQLSRAKDGLIKRGKIAKYYNESLRNKPYIKGQSGEVEGHAYHLYVGEFERRTELYTHLRRKNIFAQVHYIPTHLMPYYRNFGWKEGDMIHAEEYYNHCLSLPMYPTLNEDELIYITETIEEFYG